MRLQADRLFWISLLIPTFLLGVITLIFLHREASHLEEQEQINRTRLLQQMEERAGNIIVSILLSLQEIQSSLLQEMASIPIDRDILESLQNLTKHNQLVHQANLWDVRQGFLIKEASIWSHVSPLPWLYPPGYVSPNDLPQGVISLQPITPSQRSIRSRVQAHQQLLDLARTHSYNIPLGKSVEATTPSLDKPSTHPLPLELLPESANNRSGWIWYPPKHWLAWLVRDQQHVFVIEILVHPLMEHFQTLLPDVATSSESFQLVYERTNIPIHAEANSHDVVGLVAVGDDLPGWYLSFHAPLPANRIQPATLRWLGSLLVIGITISVTIGGLLLRQQLSAVHMDSRRKADFIANVSHELKTPLTTIRLYSEMLDSDLVSTEKRYQYLDTIQKETDRLSRLVENLLDQNRLERNAFKVNLCSTQICTLLNRLVDRVGPNVQRAGIHLTLTCSDTLFAWADPDATQQILINLIDNAIKYANSGKEISIECSHSPRGIILSVKDRGPGIRASFRSSLFSPFERGDNNLHTPQSGMGLGLSIARGLARAMGGDLIYAPRPRKGSVFSLILKPDPHHPLTS
jgi:signal transduction histidine kinase